MQKTPTFNMLKHQSWLFFSLYVLILLLNVILHEPWRDEFHSWNIARVSDGMAELMQNKTYEGHPILWYLFCWTLTRMTEAPEGLAIMHMLIVAGGGFLFFRYAPFPPVLRFIFLLGYFPLFEYGTFARNYAILIVLLWAYCWLRSKGDKTWLSLVLIGLMMFTQIYGILLAIALGIDWLWENRTKKWHIPVLGSFAFALAFLLAYLDIRPPADVTAHSRWYSDFSWENISYALSVLWDAFIPLPQFQFHFWNSNILNLSSEPLSLNLKTFGGLFIWTSLAFGVLRTARGRILFALGTLACLAFAFAKFHGYMRHHGHLFLWFWVILWLERGLNSSPLQKAQQLILYALLGIQLFAGMFASIQDWQHPFSPVKEVAAYVKEIESQQAHEIWVSDPDYLIEPIGAMLNHQLYFPRQEKMAWFPQWDKNWGYIAPEEVLRKAQLLAEKEPVLLLLGYEMKVTPAPGFQLELRRQFKPGIEATERFWIYELRKSHDSF